MKVAAIKHVVGVAAAVALAVAVGDVGARVGALAPPAGVSCGNPSRFPRDEWPSVSPDRTKVAFVRRFDRGRTPGEVGHVVVVDAMGRRARVLGRGEEAAWSPDSRELAIVRKVLAGYELVRVAADGSAARTLASGPGFVHDVSWSPDGRRLLLVQADDGYAGRLVTVAREGGTPTVLVPQKSIRSAAWSPDGAAIAVVDGFFAVQLLRADGRLLWSIALDGEFPSVSPDGLAWSPDGSQLAFSATRDPQLEYNLYVAAAGERTVRQLDETTEGYAPAWSPDGRWIGYAVEGKGIGQLYLIHPDGTENHAVPPSGRSDVLTPRYGWLRAAPAWIGRSTLVFRAFRHESAYRRGFELHTIGVDGRNDRRLTYHCQFGSRRADPALTGTYLADVIRAREGADRIDAGPGRDVVDAGPGADTLFLRDGERDVADCGAGDDTAIADTPDSLRGCERVRRARAFRGAAGQTYRAE
jgi:RTX calcium-binding nonapeptide repeat (4 copies)/WD40-like Beta Propeller Repeat